MDNKDNNKDNNKQPINKMICPDCGRNMIPSGGCTYCPNCGYSPCK